jgi:para-aminobenzoate synthetase/4-amino-4-deoxychorismate lyase
MRVVCGDGRDAFVFDEPERVFRAERIEDVAPVLALADGALADGLYVAGYVTYDAGAALVPRQANVPRDRLPFAALAAYRSRTPYVHAAATDTGFSIGPLVPERSRSAYEAAIEEILRRLHAGDVYQVNLAMPFTFSFDGDPVALFEDLNRDRAFPYAACVVDDAHAIVSCSPELFVRFAGTRIATKPMKGTASDDRLASLHSEKNRAEHVMIVDLLRNDLHRLSDDVRVERLCETERYPTYATMTSTIAAQRATSFTLAETFGAMFPCGSVTGAPKVTAMHAIAELEGRRGMFCGSIGYRAPDGSGTWNVAIRTATIDRTVRRGVVRVGGGIVADSNARDEWAEILVKRRFIERVTPAYALIATMRRDPGGCYARLDAHLARMARAADALHFTFDEARVRAHLDAIARTKQSVLVRLELDWAGTPSSSVRELEERASVTLIWSTATIDEDEPLQRYKTTWRPPYRIAEREAAARGAFDALLCNRAGFVADGARTNVFIARTDEAALLTPPVADGALGGILRAEYLADGRAREVRLTRDDVEQAHAIFIGNSARGLMSATFLQAREYYPAVPGSENTGSRKNGIAIG